MHNSIRGRDSFSITTGINLFVDKNSFSKHLNEIHYSLKQKIFLFQYKPEPNMTPPGSPIYRSKERQQFTTPSGSHSNK
jgi:hypothetical protein